MDSSIRGGRLYKSRKSRPCDCCRKRKVVCDMPEGPPCNRCSRRSLSCTFENGPGERKRRQSRTISSAIHQDDENMLSDAFLDHHVAFPDTSLFDDSGVLLLHDVALPDVENASDQFGAVNSHFHWKPPSESTGHSPLSNSCSSSSGDNMSMVSRPDTQSLEMVPDAFSFYIGPTGAADIHLLDKENFDSRDIARPKIPGLEYRRLNTTNEGSSNLHPSIFGITAKSLLEQAEPRAKGEAVEAAWNEIWSIITEDTAWRLIKLYSRYVDPYFPVVASQQIPLRSEELSNMPLCLLSSMCAAALPFVVYDERLYSLLLHPPSSARLYNIAWLDISQDLHSPTLATLQACIILQQRLPTNAYLSDTAFAWSLMSTAVAVAQTVGLHRDPMGWTSVPLWERKLRKRLWWAVWMMERWLSLVRGMPSHIHEDEYDVSELTPATITDNLYHSTHTSKHIYQLVKLTKILADVQKTYYTVRGIGETSKDLQLSLDLARAPRAYLKAWLDNLDYSLPYISRRSVAEMDLDTSDLDGSASVHLCYIVTHMTLFRALLRPLERWNEHPSSSEMMHDGARAVIRGSLACVRDFVEFLESLRDAQWNAFWHSWSRPNFAIAGCFMVHLLHVTTTASSRDISFGDQNEELRSLIRRWRTANRNSANGAAGKNGLANLGLLRVETMLGRLIKPDDR